MNISVERLPDCKARLNIEIPSDVVENERKGVVAAYSAQAKLPGYRPGKTPKAVIERKYSAQINEEVQDRLLRMAWTEAEQKESLGIIGIGQIDRQIFEADGTFAIEAEVVTQPEVDVPDYSEIAVEVPKMEVSDENIDNVLERMRENFAEFETVEGRSLQGGDIAVVEYEATHDGTPLVEILNDDAKDTPIAQSEEYWIKIPAEGEEETFLPGFGAQLDGLNAGDEKDVEISLEEDFRIEELAGKDVVYKTKVKEIKEQVLPEITDELVEKVEPGKTVEEFRESVREQMGQQQESQKEEIITNQILSHLTGSAEFELPQHIVFNETQRQVNQMVMQGYQQGMAQDQIEENQEALLESAQVRASSSIKATFILEKIAEKESIVVDDDEVTRQVMMMAAQQQRPVKKVARELQKENGFANIRHDLLISKVLEFLRGNATITEVDPPAEDASENAAEEAPESAETE